MKLTDFLRLRVSRLIKLEQVSIEEILLLSGGYSIFKVEASSCKSLIGKTLAESTLREDGVNLMAIVRKGEMMSNPTAETKILVGDKLVLFGKKEEVLRKHS